MGEAAWMGRSQNTASLDQIEGLYYRATAKLILMEVLASVGCIAWLSSRDIISRRFLLAGVRYVGVSY